MATSIKEDTSRTSLGTQLPADAVSSARDVSTSNNHLAVGNWGYSRSKSRSASFNTSRSSNALRVEESRRSSKGTAGTDHRAVLRKQLEEPERRHTVKHAAKRLKRLGVELKRAGLAMWVAVGRAFGTGSRQSGRASRLKTSWMFVTLMSAIEFLQLLAFAFKGFGWGDGFGAGYFTFAIDILVVHDVVLGISDASFTAGYVMYAVAGAVLLAEIYLVLDVLVLFLFRKAGSVQKVDILTNIVNLTARVLYIPILLPFFNSFCCLVNTSDLDPTGACDLSKILQTISVFAIIFHFTFSAAALLAMHQFNPDSGSLVAKPDERIKILELVGKTLLVLLFKVAEGVPMLRAFVFFAVALCLATYIYLFIPYYNPSFNVLKWTVYCELMCAGMLSIVIAGVMQSNSSDDHSTTIIFKLYIAGSVIIGCLSPILMYRRHHYATSMEVAMKVSQANSVKNKSKKKEDDEEAVQNAEPAAMYDDRFWEPNQVEIATRFLATDSGQIAVRLAQKIFAEGIKRFPNSARLQVSYAIFNLVYNEDAEKTEKALRQAQFLQTMFDTRILIRRIQKEMSTSKGKLSRKSTMVGNAEPVDAVDFRLLISEATTCHNVSKSLVATFWAKLMYQGEDDMRSFINLVFDMDEANTEAIDAYERLLDEYPYSKRALSNFASYMESVNHDYERARALRTQCTKKASARKASVDASLMAQTENSNFTKKEIVAYREHRNQVIIFSHSNRWRLVWIIRVIQLAVMLFAASQLTVTYLQINAVDNELRSLQVSNSCRSAVTEICHSVRTMALNTITGNDSNLMDSATTAMSQISRLSDNSSTLYSQTAVYPSVYTLWGTPWVNLDVYLGASVSPNRTIAMRTLMDATLTYIRHANTIVSTALSDTSGGTSLNETNIPLRFVLDNGLVILPDAYQMLNLEISARSRDDLNFISTVHYSVWGGVLGILVLCGFSIFHFEINGAKKDCEDSIRVFFHIPKREVLLLVAKNQDPSSTISVDDLTTQSSNSISADNGNASTGYDSASDSDDELYGDPESDNAPAENVKSSSFNGYDRLGLITFSGLALAMLSCTAAMIANVLMTQNMFSFSGMLTASMDLLHRVDRVVSVLQDVGQSNVGLTSFSFAADSARPWASALPVVINDTNAIIRDQDLIYYGDDSVAIPRRMLDDRYAHYISDSLVNDTSAIQVSSYTAVYNFADNSSAICVTPNITKTITPAIISNVDLYRQSITAGYTLLIRQLRNDASSQITAVKITAVVMFIVVVVIGVITYLAFWKRLLDNLIKAEADRTMRLLLMIPVEVANEVKAIRELLHLSSAASILSTFNGEQSRRGTINRRNTSVRRRSSSRSLMGQQSDAVGRGSMQRDSNLIFRQRSGVFDALVEHD